MNEKLLSDLYQKLIYPDSQIKQAINYVKEFENYLKQQNLTMEETEIEDIKNYLEFLITENKNNADRLVAIARYFYLISKNEIYIYFTKILGRIGVVESIKGNLNKLKGNDFTESIFDNLKEPPLGSDFLLVNKFTADMMDRFEKNLSITQRKKVLAGNHHQIPAKAFKTEKEKFNSFDTWDEYLKDRHRRKVAELQEHCDQNKVWYEQKITQPVVDFVKNNQEILSAVKKDNCLMVTKIPYDPDRYLKESDPLKKKYYACHCPLARESILSDQVNISPHWCYCSGGFAKYPFEVILDQELEVELLECVLKGDDRCRFAIKLP